MKKILLLTLLIGLISADNNKTIKSSDKNESNSSIELDRTKKHIQEQIEREKKYAKEMRFYQGSEYNLSAVEINPDSLDSVPLIESQDDFNMDDAYSDIQ